MRAYRGHLISLVGAGLALALALPLTWAGPAVARQLTDPPKPQIPSRYLTQAIHWAPCSFDAAVKRALPTAPTTNCATIKAPMDWRAPNAHPDIKVAIAHSLATGVSRGLLASNPGGPGAAGLALSAALAIDKPRLFSDFDLVGFDPRGFGASEALPCVTTAAQVNALPQTPDRRERTKLTHRVEIAEGKLWAKACSSSVFSQFVSSQQTVSDLELIRALLKARQLNFIGYSYGTWLGGWYADTYPARVGRFLLDSNMDFTRTQWANLRFDPFSAQRRRDQQLFPWIARHADQIAGLGQTSARVAATYEKIRASLVSLQRRQLSAVSAMGLDGNVYSASYSDRRFIRATMDILVHDEFVRAPSTSGRVDAGHVKRAWARLAPELQAYDSLAAISARYGVSGAQPLDAVGGFGSMLADGRAAAARASQADQPINLGANGMVVRCNDTAWSHQPTYYTDEVDRMAKRYPFLGYLNGVPFCAFWKFLPQDRRVNLAGSPRLLMIQSELDPATAWEGAYRTHRTLASRTRLVSIDDEGQHGVYLTGTSLCAQEIGDRFLFSGELPGRDRTCGTTPLPAEGGVYPVAGPLDGARVPLSTRSAETAGRPKPNAMLQRILDQSAAAGLG